jgi:hypothetical protein
LIVAALFSWNMRSHIELEPVRQVRAVLEMCRSQGLKNVVLASDSPDWNIETFLLARELMGGTTTGIRLSTVVYSVMQENPISDDFQALENGDAVVIETPTSSNSAAVNTRTEEYRRFVQSHEERIESGVQGLEVFRHHR